MNYVKPIKHKLTLVVNTLFFPFTFPEIFDALKEREYKISSLPGPIPAGQRSYLEGHIGMKNNCLVEINDTRKIIGTEGVVIEDVIKTMEEIIEMSVNDFKLKENEMDYLELISNLHVKTDKSPIKTIGNFGESYRVFDNVFNLETAPYSIKIVPKNVNPSSKNWFDILVEPRLTKPEREYFVHIIYRNTDFNNVLTFARNINTTISSVIEIIGDQLDAN
ncbi:MAG: hypothetical protein PVF58_01425 [Candidatus Methanofastidiosia archaeon]|jgi:hypothetical protein